MLPLLDSYLLPKFYFTHKFESFIHQLLFIIDLRFSKWGWKIVHSYHLQQQSNCYINERGWMGKKSKETKSFSLYFAKLVQPYRFPVLWLNGPVFTIYRFLGYFRFYAITGPNWRPVLGWTGRTDRSGPIFKTMGRTCRASSNNVGKTKMLSTINSKTIKKGSNGLSKTQIFFSCNSWSLIGYCRLATDFFSLKNSNT